MARDLDFQAVYSEYQPRILRYLTGLVGEYSAEDLTQEVFIRVHLALDSFRGESKLGTWIYRIAANAAIDHLRQGGQRHELSLEGGSAGEDEPDPMDRAAWNGEPAPAIEYELFLREGFDCFCDFLKDLPETYRLVVSLDKLGEYSAREIAGLLGMSVEAVKMRLHRGREMLLKELKEHCKLEDWL